MFGSAASAPRHCPQSDTRRGRRVERNPQRYEIERPLKDPSVHHHELVLTANIHSPTTAQLRALHRSIRDSVPPPEAGPFPIPASAARSSPQSCPWCGRGLRRVPELLRAGRDPARVTRRADGPGRSLRAPPRLRAQLYREGPRRRRRSRIPHSYPAACLLALTAPNNP